MIIHEPSQADTWSIWVLDQHTGVHDAERPSPEALRAWMREQDAQGAENGGPFARAPFFTSDDEWEQAVSAARRCGVVRVETEFDCDFVLWRNA